MTNKLSEPAYLLCFLVCLGLLAAAFPIRASGQDSNLVNAAKAGNDWYVGKLLDTGTDPRGQAAHEAVLEASRSGHAKVLEVLLSRGADVDVDDRDFSSPRKAITLAAEKGSTESVAILLRYGADPSTRNTFPFRFSLHGDSPSDYIDNHKSALMYAAEGGHVGIVQLLLKAGAKPNAETVYGETALMFGAGNGHTEVVRILVHGGAKLNATASKKKAMVTRVRRDRYGGTALTYAVRHAYYSMLDVARVKGVMIECREYLGPAYEIVKAYEERKERVGDAAEILGFSLLCGDTSILSRLIALKALKRGSDVLLYVGGHHNRDTAEAAALLIHAGADVNAREKKPWDTTPLMSAAMSGTIRTAKVLINAGAEINATTSYGESALWHAARKKHVDIVKLLLSHGANPNIVTKPSPQWFSKGGTALHIAVESGCMECVNELLKRGADPRIPDSSGNKPFGQLQEAGVVRVR